MPEPGVVNLRGDAGSPEPQAPPVAQAGPNPHSPLSVQARGITGDDVSSMHRYLHQTGELGVNDPAQGSTPATPPAVPSQGAVRGDDGRFAPPLPAQDVPPEPGPGAQPEAAPPGPSAAGNEPPGFAQTMSDIAQHYGVEEPEFLNAISVPGNDGADVSLASVIEGYRAQPEAAEVVRQRGTLEGEFADERAKLREEHQEGIHETMRLAAMLNEQLGASLPAQDEMDRLRVDNPLRWQELRLNYFEKREALGKANAEIQAKVDERQKAVEADQASWVKREAEKTIAMWPELKDEETSRKVAEGMATFLGKTGFNQDEILQLRDHRMLKIVRLAQAGASMLDKGREAIETARQRGLPVPKGRPGQRSPKSIQGEQPQENYQKLVSKMGELGGTEQKRDNLKLAHEAMLARIQGAQAP